MRSLHLDAFFAYLLNNPHPYWTDIPPATTTNPVLEGGRDGVAPEDDMALRSLLPHIRPRRGRKRPDERTKNSNSGGGGTPPSTQQRPQDTIDGGGSEATAAQQEQQQQQLDFLATPHADARGNDFFYPPRGDHFGGMTMDHTGVTPWLQPEAFATTTHLPHPLSSAHSYNTDSTTPIPNHNPTSSTENTLWQQEQQSRHQHVAAQDSLQQQQPHASTGVPTTPSSSSSTTATTTGPKQSKRHGAKAVSSAWRAGGPGGSGKTRGRPPMKRNNTNRQPEGLGPSNHSNKARDEEVFPFSAFRTLHFGSNISMASNSSNSPSSTVGYDKPQMPTAMMTVGSNASMSLPATTTMAALATTQQIPPAYDELSLFGMQFEAQPPQQHIEGQRQVPGQLQSLQVPERMGDGGIFPHQGMAGPEIHMMDPFAARGPSAYMDFELEHDLRFQTRPQDADIGIHTPSCQSTTVQPPHTLPLHEKDPQEEEEEEKQEEAAGQDAEADRIGDDQQTACGGQGQGHVDESEGGIDGEDDHRDEAAWWRRRYQDLLGVVEEQTAEIRELRRREVLWNQYLARARPAP